MRSSLPLDGRRSRQSELPRRGHVHLREHMLREPGTRRGSRVRVLDRRRGRLPGHRGPSIRENVAKAASVKSCSTSTAVPTRWDRWIDSRAPNNCLILPTSRADTIPLILQDLNRGTLTRRRREQQALDLVQVQFATVLAGRGVDRRSVGSPSAVQRSRRPGRGRARWSRASRHSRVSGSRSMLLGQQACCATATPSALEDLGERLVVLHVGSGLSPAVQGGWLHGWS